MSFNKMNNKKEAKESEYSTLSDSTSASLDENVGYIYPIPRRRFRLSIHVVAYPLIILCNMFLFGLWVRESHYARAMRNDADANCVRPLLTYSPVREAGATSYELRTLYRHITNNRYTGAPRPEIDAAWADLIEPMTIKLSPEEWHHAGLKDDTLRYKDGSGYISEMAVYHELHCNKRIRRHLSLDYYMPNISVDDLHRENVHIDHCLEYWREAAMCRGDASLATMFWRDGLPTSRVYSDHECVNWEALDTWARSKMVDMDDLDVLDQAHRYDLISTTAGKTVQAGDPEEKEVHP